MADMHHVHDRLSVIVAVLAVLAGNLAGGAARADRIVLRHGGSIDTVGAAERRSGVVLARLSGGATLTLTASQVLRIERDAPPEPISVDTTSTTAVLSNADLGSAAADRGAPDAAVYRNRDLPELRQAAPAPAAGAAATASYGNAELPPVSQPTPATSTTTAPNGPPPSGSDRGSGVPRYTNDDLPDAAEAE